jgi:MoxR-like ATPase
MQIDVLYPDVDAERRMLFETTGADETRAHAVLSAADLMQIQALVRRMPVGEAVVEAILKLVRAVRPARPAATLPSRYPGDPARAPARR